MRILQINASYKPAYLYGGPTMSVSKLAEVLNQNKILTDVLCTTANGVVELDVIPGKKYNIDGVEVIYFKRLTKDHSHFSPALLRYLYQNIHNYQLVHIHAWWNLVSVLSALICYIKKKPFILSPRGTLSTYSFNNRTSTAKKYFHRFIGKPVLQRANFLLTSRKEESEMKQLFGNKIKTAVIPNFVRLQKVEAKYELSKNRLLRVVFLSRIDEKKGLEFLFRAVADMEQPVSITLAGNGNEQYINNLKTLANQLNISQKINWIGFVNDEAKFNLLAEHDLMILPSYNENFANVVIESLSVGTAVLITEHVGLADFILEHNLGWVCKQEAAAIKTSIQTIINSPQQLKEIREKGSQIINTFFDEDYLVKKYISYYQSIINEPV